MKVRDCTAAIRCWRREALAAMPLDRIVSDGYSFLVEMLFLALEAGCRIAEVPIIFVERRVGASKISRGVIRRVVLDAVAAGAATRAFGSPAGLAATTVQFVHARDHAAIACAAGLSIFFPAYNDSGTIASWSSARVRRAPRR